MHVNCFFILFAWSIIGACSAFVRLVEFNWFHNLSWGQIAIFSILIGPAWLLIGVIWVFVLFLKKIEELWNLLGEIGKR
jgi:hypothetical protein